jgi:hypothetical protein
MQGKQKGGVNKKKFAKGNVKKKITRGNAKLVYFAGGKSLLTLNSK